ncbi:MAG: DEAD/DEAH box helicase [Deltaproteobacteria bacterium]|nr:DEAD/DEAH box helicase [Deltaproteobacteria bacterium]
MNFDTFSFHPSIAANIAAAGYEVPTPIQEMAIPKVKEGHDIMGLAQTGTGKTAAFALPILNRLIKGKQGGVRALVIAPTRELAEQIHQSFETLGKKTNIKSVTVYGGVGINPQIQKLRSADIVVACPGRLIDHIERKTISLTKVEVLVLDEADQMFDMGFLPNIRRILKHLPKARQTLLFSATMPQEIKQLASDILKNPSTVQAGVTAPAETVSHAIYPVAQHLKTDLLLELLETSDPGSVLVFTRTKHRAKSLEKRLAAAGYRSASIQGNLSQSRRQAALEGFKSGEFQILVATDIAARGIDVSRISHVINYDIPATPEAYIHRIGRTGRAECSGEAFTLATKEDKDMVKAINRLIGSEVEQRTISTFNYGSPDPDIKRPSIGRVVSQRRFPEVRNSYNKRRPAAKIFS